AGDRHRMALERRALPGKRNKETFSLVPNGKSIVQLPNAVISTINEDNTLLKRKLAEMETNWVKLSRQNAALQTSNQQQRQSIKNLQTQIGLLDTKQGSQTEQPKPKKPKKANEQA